MRRPTGAGGQLSRNRCHSSNHVSEKPGAVQERYRVFFLEIIDRLREAPAYTNARIAQPHGGYAFSSRTSGISYAASFSRDAFRVEVYIDIGSREENKRSFDAPYAQAGEIQSSIELPICWERLDKRRVSRIAICLDITIDDSDEELAQARDWAIENPLKFREVFGPRLAEIVEPKPGAVHFP